MSKEASAVKPVPKLIKTELCSWEEDLSVKKSKVSPFTSEEVSPFAQMLLKFLEASVRKDNTHHH